MFHVVTPPPVNPSRDDIIWLAGPRLVGLIFNWGLLGVLTTQIYIYHINFPKDRRHLKILVYIVYILDWIQTCSATYDAFQWFVYGWGSIPALYNLFTGFLNVPILSSMIGSLVQIYFGWRIWILSRSATTFSLISLLSLLQLGAGGVVAYHIYTDASEVTRSVGLVRAVGIRLGGSAAVDTLIAVSMTYFLLRSRGQALSHTNTILTRLIRLTIETGTATAIAAIVDLIFFVRAHNGLHQVSGVILCKLYSNTLLVLFNNRLVMANQTVQDFASSAQQNSPHSGSRVEWNPRAEVDQGELMEIKFATDVDSGTLVSVDGAGRFLHSNL
ncbi:putative transmembrane protein [Favolaschia claudopus]|uniref:Transmembrane protein n=1 Tax=Favolaschia claudopus TaxID=2862362 RepID=A0AAW0DIJ7_9AGAR